MRVFTEYSARRIAKYVKSFFKGSFRITGYSCEFIFDCGKVICSKTLGKAEQKVVSEVNYQITLIKKGREANLSYSN